jgi:hypothetical protein
VVLLDTQMALVIHQVVENFLGVEGIAAITLISKSV